MRQKEGENLAPGCQWWCIAALDYLTPNFYGEKNTLYWVAVTEYNSGYEQPCEPDIKGKQNISEENKGAND